MHFSQVYLTSSGYSALGGATAGGTQGDTNAQKIIWGSAYTSSTDIRQWSSTQINGASGSDFNNSYTSAGYVTSVTHGAYTPANESNSVEAATLTIELNNGNYNSSYQYSGNAYTLLIFGKTSDSATEELFIIASIGPDATPDVVSSTEPFNAIINCHVQISQNTVSEITAPNGWYAPASDLNALSNRVVTTYKDGDTSSGDDQTIKGVKTFSNDTKHSGNILPYSSSGLNIGSSSYKWNTIYATTFNGNATSANKWQTSRTFTIKDNDSTNSGNSVSVDGTSNVVLRLPSIIKARLDGNATTATTASNVSVWGRVNNEDHPLLFTGDVNSSTSFTVAMALFTDTVNSLSYNPSTNTLKCTNFSGSLSGNATTATTATQVKITGNSINNWFPLVFTSSYNSSTSSAVDRTLFTDTANSLCYNPNTNTLFCDTFSGNLNGNATTATTATKATQDINGNAFQTMYAGGLIKNGTVTEGSTNTVTSLSLKNVANNGSLSTIYLSDIIANALCGRGGFGDTPTNTFGSIGSVGLFLYMGRRTDSTSIDLSRHHGNLVSGLRLARVGIRKQNYDTWFSDNGSALLSDFMVYADWERQTVGAYMTGTWCLLSAACEINQSATNSGYYHCLVLAVRVY